ncbi:MAG: PIG-L deacetylase family protein [Acidimicrobiales bacterium]
MSELPDLSVWKPRDGVRRVMVIAAHPDDIDFGAAGSVAVLTENDVEVSYCVVTNGDAGGFDDRISREEMARIRQEEQRAAAGCVGVNDVVFLGYPDGRVESTIELRRDLSRQIRVARPDRVIAPSPERMWNRIFASHPDHLATGEAAVCAVYPDSRNPFAHPELLESERLEPHTVAEMWLMADPNPNVAVDVTNSFERKLAALRCHSSQVGDGDDLRRHLGEIGSTLATSAGLPAGSLAEAFRVVKTA